MSGRNDSVHACTRDTGDTCCSLPSSEPQLECAQAQGLRTSTVLSKGGWGRRSAGREAARFSLVSFVPRAHRLPRTCFLLHLK